MKGLTIAGRNENIINFGKINVKVIEIGRLLAKGHEIGGRVRILSP